MYVKYMWQVVTMVTYACGSPPLQPHYYSYNTVTLDYNCDTGLAESLQQCKTTSSEVLTTRAITSCITAPGHWYWPGHLLYASSLASRSHKLHTRLRDMSRTNMVLWLDMYLPRPSLRYTTGYNIYTYILTHCVPMTNTVNGIFTSLLGIK